MRKVTKILLAGAGVVFAGAVGYVLLKKKDVGKQSIPTKEASDTTRASVREFVERRKKRVAEARAAKKAEIQKSPSI